MELEPLLYSEEFHHLSSRVDVEFVLVAHEELLLVLRELHIVFLVLYLIHRLHIVADLLIKEFFNCCPAVRHHVLRLVLAEVEVHGESAHKLVDQILNAFQWLGKELRRLFDILILHMKGLDVLRNVLTDRVLIAAQNLMDFIYGI